MKLDQQQHPDLLTDRKRLYNIMRGGMQALEDIALDAYTKVIEAGGSKEQARAEFFKVFEKYDNEDKL